jgi:hypothetical protein
MVEEDPSISPPAGEDTCFPGGLAGRNPDEAGDPAAASSEAACEAKVSFAGA